MKLKLAYFGTPDFSARFLEKLLTDEELPIEVVCVVTQPDKPVGRRQQIEESPVKKLANKFNIPVFDSLEKVGGRTRGAPIKPQRSEDLFGAVEGQAPLAQTDLALVYAYGQIIPADILKLPIHGFWNIHPSRLPYFRGPSPTAYPLILGEKITGVTLMKMDEKMDHGPIIDQIDFSIPPEMRRPELEEKLTDLGYELFKKIVSSNQLLVTSNVQDENIATYTKLFKKIDGYIALSILKQALTNEPLTFKELPEIVSEYYSRHSVILSEEKNPMRSFSRLNRDQDDVKSSSQVIYNLFRGLYPWPGIWTNVTINNKELRLKIKDLRLENGKLEVLKVQLEGKQGVDFKTFNDAYRVF